jgi:hypothetical protein
MYEKKLPVKYNEIGRVKTRVSNISNLCSVDIVASGSFVNYPIQRLTAKYCGDFVDGATNFKEN